MTTISAKIVADSISPAGKRLTTLELRYPRFIHAELMTHRVFSRNARSSRAVPVPKMIQECIDDPVVPIHWGAAQKGMQAYEECNELIVLPRTNVPGEYLIGSNLSSFEREAAWLRARDAAVQVAEAFHVAGYAKQVINRLLEPFLHIDTLVSATEWANWDGLRDHHMAEPHIEALAKAIKVARAASTPRLLQPGQWHLPYADGPDERAKVWDRGQFNGPPEAIDAALIKLSVARCARISYAPFDGDASIEAELKRYDLLVGSAPLHASPAEHQATPDTYVDDRAMVKEWANPKLHGNFNGWQQFRKTLPGECIAA